VKNVAEVLAVIEHPDMGFQASRDTVNLAWDVTPAEYLQFAEKDLADGDKRGVINALSNAKRALECQIDSLLIAFALPKSTNRSVPDKLAILKRIGLIAPPILRKINSHRNEMEHRYACPVDEQVRDFVDVVSLFLESTRFHLLDRRCEWEFALPNGKSLVQVILHDDHISLEADRGRVMPFRVEAGTDEFFELLSTIARRTAWETFRF
jgi:hypothetical protein